MVETGILTKRDRGELVHGEIVHMAPIGHLHDAAAGVPEAWIVDVDGRRIETYRTPRAGEYADVDAFAREAVVTPMAFPDLAIPVIQIVG